MSIDKKDARLRLRLMAVAVHQLTVQLSAFLEDYESQGNISGFDRQRLQNQILGRKTWKYLAPRENEEQGDEHDNSPLQQNMKEKK